MLQPINTKDDLLVEGIYNLQNMFKSPRTNLIRLPAHHSILQCNHLVTGQLRPISQGYFHCLSLFYS